MVQHQAVRHPGAAVMADKPELAKAELPHEPAWSRAMDRLA
jgi:hypothetical protein